MPRSVPRREEAYPEMQKLQDLGNSLAHSGLGGWDDCASELSLTLGQEISLVKGSLRNKDSSIFFKVVHMIKVVY